MSLSSLAIAGDATHSFSETNNCPSTLVPQASCQATLSSPRQSPASFRQRCRSQTTLPAARISVHCWGWHKQCDAATGLFVLHQSELWQPDAGYLEHPASDHADHTGNATLHISAISLTGSYPKDWTQTNTCTVPLAAQGTCTISVTFSPSDNGVLSAFVNIADDAPNSPQTINLYGNAPPAVLLNASANGGSTTATVPAGQTATYDLQAMPGPNFTGTITFTCSGVPLARNARFPPAWLCQRGRDSLHGVDLNIVSCAAAVFPGLPRQSPGSLRPQPGFSLAFFAAMLLFALTLRSRMQSQAPRWLASVTAATL